ncbi:MAG: sulfurtransferase TusA family protein, partial [Desulfobacterales bacterium]|nr:sulfurtransferase TusA family protein [Desulfobacterales bacterium]
MVDVTPDVTLDLKGLSCPMPTIKMKKELKGMKSGQVMLAIGTDPGTKNDLPGMC